MKRKLALALAILICLGIPAAAAAAAKDTAADQKYKVTVSFGVKKIRNDHVGNSWVYVIEAGDTTIKKGGSAAFELTGADTLSLICQATERDKIPDIGTTGLVLAMRDLKEGKNTFTANVTVTENRGRYSGNTAEWKFTVTVKVKPIG